MHKHPRITAKRTLILAQRGYLSTEPTYCLPGAEKPKPPRRSLASPRPPAGIPIYAGSQVFPSGQQGWAPPQAQAHGERWSARLQRLPSPRVALLSSTPDSTSTGTAIVTTSDGYFRIGRRDASRLPEVPLQDSYHQQGIRRRGISGGRH